MGRADGKHWTWRLTRAQRWHFQELLEQLNDLNEHTDRYRAIVDEMKSIPGYPRAMDPDLDTFEFELTDSTPITTGGLIHAL